MSKIWLLWLYGVALHSTINAGSAPGSQCPVRKSISYLNGIKDVRILRIGDPVTVALDRGQQKRLKFHLNVPTPLLISFSAITQNFSRKLYFNQTVNLSRYIKTDAKDIFVPCAIDGYYDLILTAKKLSSIKIEITDQHPSANWPLLNRSIPIRVRYQNRMQKRQMILKWSKSKLDIHAMQYCLVINANSTKSNFCEAVTEFWNSSSAKTGCQNTSPMENVWFKQREKVRKIDPSGTNVICTGSKSQQVLKGLASNTKYFIDIFGVHTKLRNLTILLKSTAVWFNRTHPNQIKENSLSVEKISGMTSVSIFSFKVPANSETAEAIRYFILPCGGSQIDVKILKQRQKIRLEKNIYKPTYITMKNIKPGDRHIVRVTPSNEDEVLRANKVGIAVTTKDYFPTLPNLPANTSLYEIRSFRNCGSTTIAWYAAPEVRNFRYCVLVFTMPSNNRSLADQTNYCMDFGKRVTRHPQFFQTNCFEPTENKIIEHSELLNLNPGDSYLVYVTVNLIGGKSLPYQSLKVNVNKHCHNDLDEVAWSNNSSYYDN